MSVVGFLSIQVVLSILVIVGIVTYMAGASDPRGYANAQGFVGVVLVLAGFGGLIWNIVYFLEHHL